MFFKCLHRPDHFLKMESECLTFCILMALPIHIDTISPLSCHVQNFLNYDVFLSLRVVLTLANSADPDEMQLYAAFYLGLHCLPKYQM